MNIIDIKKVEDCFDGSFIKEYTLSESIDALFIRHLAGLGVLKYFKEFARPFFTVIDSKKIKLKGVEGNDFVRAVFFNVDGNGLQTERELVEKITAFNK